MKAENCIGTSRHATPECLHRYTTQLLDGSCSNVGQFCSWRKFDLACAWDSPPVLPWLGRRFAPVLDKTGAAALPDGIGLFGSLIASISLS